MNKLQTLLFSVIISLAVAGIVFAFTNPSGNPPIGGGTIGVGSNAPANSLYIKSDGNVGIGMTGPVYKLDVNGSFNATSLYISGVLKNTVWDAKESGIATGTTAQYWRGDKTWQTLTGTLPSGTSGQTLRHDGTNWVANSILSNDGTKITINGTVDNLLTLSRSGAASSTVFKLGTDSALIVNSGGSDVLTLKGGNVGIGTTGPGAKLEVAGQVKITGGTPGAGKVLTSDAAGLASWQISPTEKFCNSVDTYNGSYSWIGYSSISLLIDGRNICEDINGCSYRIWQYNVTYPQGVNNYINYPIIFRQISDGRWIDSYGDNKGTNGDSVSTNFVNWGGMYLYDDYSGVETNKNALTWRDNDTGAAFIITLCDY